jgi:hypothetical protein
MQISSTGSSNGVMNDILSLSLGAQNYRFVYMFMHMYAFDNICL